MSLMLAKDALLDEAKPFGNDSAPAVALRAANDHPVKLQLVKRIIH